MATPPFDHFFKQFTESLPKGVLELHQDMEKNMRAAMESTFRRMNLVTREEFEVQSQLLTRLQIQLVTLEEKVAELEAELNKTSSNAASAQQPPSITVEDGNT